MLPQQQDLITSYLLSAIRRISESAPAVFGLDGYEVGAEEVILKISSRLGDRLQSYIYVSFVLKVAADMMDRDGLGDRLPQLLRLMEMISP